MMQVKQPSRIILFLVGIIITLAITALPSFAGTRQYDAGQRPDTFVFAPALGLQSDTPDGTAFAVGFYGDYYINHNVSIGPLVQMGFTDDLFQLGLTAQAKYTFHLADPALKPHVQAGIGVIYADLDRSAGRDDDDSSFLIPLGLGAEYKLTNSVWLDTTVLFNFTDLDVRNENFFVTLLVGLKFPF